MPQDGATYSTSGSATTSSSTPGSLFANPTAGIATTSSSTPGGQFEQVLAGGTQIPTVNNPIITLSINGDSQSFTLNQANAETLTYTIATSGGSTTDTYVDDLAFNEATRQLILEYSDDKENLVVTLPDWQTQTEVDTSIEDAIAGLAIPRNFIDLDGTPRAFGTIGQSLRVDASGNELEFYTPTEGPGGMVDQTDFTSQDGSVLVGMDGVLVSLQARPTYVGNGGNGGIADGDTVNASTFSVDPTLVGPNGRQLILSNTNGSVVLTEAAEGPTPPSAPQEAISITPNRSFFDDTPEDVIKRVTVSNAAALVGATATATGPDGNPVTVTSTVNGFVVTVTLAANLTYPVGSYTINTSITARDTGGVDHVLTTSTPWEHYTPYSERRGTDITEVSGLEGTGATISNTGFTLPISVRIAHPLTGNLYIGINQDELNAALTDGLNIGDIMFGTVTTNGVLNHVRAGLVRTLNVTQNGVTVQYSIIRFGGTIPNGAVISEFT